MAKNFVTGIIVLLSAYIMLVRFVSHACAARAMAAVPEVNDVLCGLWHRTPLMLAASRGHVDMTTFLVSASADVNAVDIYQRTTLHMVVRSAASLLSTASATAVC